MRQEYSGGIPRDESLLSYAIGVWSWYAMGHTRVLAFRFKYGSIEDSTILVVTFPSM